MVSAAEILKKLEANARPDQLEGMAKYGMVTENRLGVAIPILRKLAKDLGKDHKLALELWKTGIPEARILAGMVDDPAKLTDAQMDAWVKDLNTWDVCDQLCMNLFEKTPLAWKKIHEWSEREEEFVKRAAFSMLACLAWHGKTIEDEKFIKLFPVIIRASTDERNYVKKSVNWALRNIGKRNLEMNKAAIKLAKELQKTDSKPAQWIGSDAVRELASEKLQTKLKKHKK